MIRKAPIEEVMLYAMEEWGGTAYTIDRTGYEAVVGVVDDAPEPYVVKTLPEQRALEGETILWEEGMVLSLFQAADDCPLFIPRPLAHESSPVYAVHSKVPGSVYSNATVQLLTPAKRREAGRRLGECMAWSHQAIDPEEFLREREQHAPLQVRGFKWSYDAFFEEYIRDFDHPDYPVLSDAAAAHWRLFRQHYPNGADHAGDRVNHMDLHTRNVTWQDDRIVGAFDWGSVQIGDIHQELRGALRMGDDILEAAIDELADHKVYADPERVRFWNNLRIIGVLCWHIIMKETDSLHFSLGINDINCYYPSSDWSELRQRHVLPRGDSWGH